MPYYENGFKGAGASEQILRDQFVKLRILLGEEFFNKNINPDLNTTVGFIFMKEMTQLNFLEKANYVSNLFNLVKSLRN